jgi:translation elongation factor EF-Ts
MFLLFQAGVTFILKTLSSEKLNFIIAVSAIAISAASFYATYLQARSADQQVKAMTYPLLQLDHGNFDLETRTEKLYFLLVNSGVGPARVELLNYSYQGAAYPSLDGFLSACCQPEYEQYKALVHADEVSFEDSLITGNAKNVILSAGDQFNLITMENTPKNQDLWKRINKERFNNFSVEVCYCSLLDQCYQLNDLQQVSAVEQCAG